MKKTITSSTCSSSKLLLTSMLILLGLRVMGQGATTPFRSTEAEAGSLAGGATVRTMSILPSQPTPELEASGRTFVELNAADQSVSWVNNTGITANTMVVRASVPDTPTGGGADYTLDLYIDGFFRQTVKFTSRYSWQYGTVTDWADNNPAHGTPHRYWDESRFWITGSPIAPGSTIMFKKGATNTAAFYYLDIFDLENVGPALTQPANTLSITSYGAVSGDGNDDTKAIKDCIAACQSSHQGMWIPVGSFETDTAVDASNITISGAGMWYTTLVRTIGKRIKWSLTNCTLRDLYVFGAETARDLAHGHDYGFTIQGSGGWLVERVWLHNVGAGFWCSGTDGTIQNCRCSNDWADGINLNNGSSVQANNAGLRLTAQNNYVRGCTDDGIAINAQNGGGTTYNMVDTKVLNNSSVAIIYANGIRVAGGRNSLIQDNYVSDPADLSGVVLGTFGTSGNPCESVTVKNNYFIRCGGYRSTVQGSIYVNSGGTATVQDNMVVDASTRAVYINNFNVTCTGNVIVHPALNAFYIKSGAVGTANISYNTAVNMNAGQLPFKNDGTATFTTPIVIGNSWQQTATEVSFYQNTNYGGTAGQELPDGNYTQSLLATKGVSNDWASSARVPAGKKIIMYSGDNYTGTSWTLTYDTPNFSRLSPSADEQMSSCQVMTDGSSPLAFAQPTSLATEPNQPGEVIKVYPNPATTIIKVSNIKDKTRIRITNWQGRLQIDTVSGPDIDVSSLKPGLYILSAGTNKAVKFLKN
ncbi:right-handed parallel beta-helix repeat-containing protein [Mucilaginibacter sabulilitoris]|uniref:Right-handed parallel beta-helix repeat-containing protein n=1 Tax=Mucilaginibacter sabulilitoris TaxID=1173583 RepID=A0ABZ0TRQ2_9SPHI|nr:T9SS type A sorting domain-containing protein [Mucilaginibacter sabulilitoris]WPU94743.1 right-handed parallel beta-helix repeat-containing protein [Mucilaginibacter sabulilitoris]